MSRYVDDRVWGPAVLLMLALVWSGCGDNLYENCEPDENLQCDQSSYSCVSRPVFECDKRLCAKYQGGRTYCTQRCDSNSDCPNGECKRFILGRSEQYCVPNDQLDDGGSSGGGDDAAAGG